MLRKPRWRAAATSTHSPRPGPYFSIAYCNGPADVVNVSGAGVVAPPLDHLGMGRVLFFFAGAVSGTDGRCLSCDNRRTESWLRAVSMGCASEHGCFAPTVGACIVLFRYARNMVNETGQRSGRCLSCDNRRTEPCRRAVSMRCASEHGCFAPTVGACIVLFRYARNMVNETGQRSGRCLSCDNRRTESWLRAVSPGCASEHGCIAPTVVPVSCFFATPMPWSIK